MCFEYTFLRNSPIYIISRKRHNRMNFLDNLHRKKNSAKFPSSSRYKKDDFDGNVQCANDDSCLYFTVKKKIETFSFLI